MLLTAYQLSEAEPRSSGPRQHTCWRPSMLVGRAPTLIDALTASESQARSATRACPLLLLGDQQTPDRCWIVGSSQEAVN